MKLETKNGPFMKSSDNVSKIMRRLVIALIPIIIFAVYKNGYLLYSKGYTNVYGIFYPLIFIILGSMSSLISEELFLYVFKHQRGSDLIDAVKSNYGFLPGLFLALVLPINTPLAILFIGGVLASIIGKMISGGIGSNIFNPALVGALLIITCYGALISNQGGYMNRYELDAISSATPLTNAKMVHNIDYDTLIKPYGDMSVFAIGLIPGTLGETSSILIILAFFYLAFTKTIKWRISVTYILTFMVLVMLSSMTYGVWYILFQLLSGGLLFGSVFMATDPVTSPITRHGQILYGILLGLMTFLIRYYTNYPEGVMTSILFMDLFVPFIDRIGSMCSLKKSYNLIFIIALIMIAVIGINSRDILKNNEDEEFKIINVLKDNKYTKYEVKQKGFGGYIKALITFDDFNITNIEILEHNESEDRYEYILDEDYVNKLIKSQSIIEDVDTISGATVTSGAIKSMVINTMNDRGIKTEPTVKVLSREVKNDATLYVLATSSFSGSLELQVTLKNGVIRSAIPLKYNDTCVSKSDSEYYTCPSYMDEGYIEKLIKNQNNIDNVDTVSGATISSKAIKDIFAYILKSGLE